MKRYIKFFETHAEYEAFIQTEDFVLPNVTFCNNIPDEVHYNPIVPPDYSQDYLTFEALEDGTFKFTNPINYSIDNGTTWVELAANTASPTITSGNKIMWKAELTPNNSSGIGTFSSTKKFNVEGKPMSLLFGDNFVGQTDLTGKNYAFYELFYNCSKLISAENLSLPATTLANNCYQGMFQNCTSLTTAPELPATTLANYCYYRMFYDCTSLTTAPHLPATTLTQGCYYEMFSRCTSLTIAPELPATILSNKCYQFMFEGCTSLTTAPELPATTLASNCYDYMFYNCTSLTTAPELPATTLADYCYSGMFNGCTNLNYVKCLATNISANGCTISWLNNVKRNGTFVKDASMTTWLRNETGIPSTWIVEDYQE